MDAAGWVKDKDPKDELFVMKTVGLCGAKDKEPEKDSDPVIAIVGFAGASASAAVTAATTTPVAPDMGAEERGA